MATKKIEEDGKVNEALNFDELMNEIDAENTEHDNLALQEAAAKEAAADVEPEADEEEEVVEKAIPVSRVSGNAVKSVKELKTDAENSKKAKKIANTNFDNALMSNIEIKRADDKNYMQTHTNAMLSICKNDKKVKVLCDKIYALYFGKVFTFVINCVPVTVRFDGTIQEFPERVAKAIQRKMVAVSNSNFPKNENTEIKM